METSERKPIDARCKSRPEREAVGADESTAESGTAEAAPKGRAAKPSSAYGRGAETSSAYRRAAKATTPHPAMKASSVEATTTPNPLGTCCR